MIDRDPAFLWETEALRETRPPTRIPIDPASGSGPIGSGWRTLREAYEATGIPVGTLRKWARLGVVPSYMDANRPQSLRMVKMDAVIDRAEAQGRTTTPIPVLTEDQEVIVDLRDEPEQPPMSRDGIAAPPGTMIVPVAAWDKMLMQLGNLHEAGQQLAEAKERAAKAETEAVFLRERLADLRRDTERPAVPEHPGPIAPPPPRTSQLWRVMYRRWVRSRRR